MRHLGEKNVYEGSEQLEKSRKEGIAETEMKNKWERETCLAALKTCFVGEDLKWKGGLWPESNCTS